MELPRLCSLKLRFDGQCSWSKEMVLKLIHWIQDIEKRGQRLDVHWDIKCSRPRHYSILDCILGAFGDSAGHTFTLRVGVEEPEPIARFPQLLQKLTKLEIKHAYDNFFFFQQYAALFGDHDITYPKLHTLVLSQKGNRDEPRRYRIINIIPDHFPSLRHLVLGFEDHHGFVNMEPTFKHDWESVTELSVVMFDIGYDMRCLLDGFSNVTKLSISEVFCVLNLYTIAEQMPQLQYLILHQIYDKIVVSPEEFYEFYEYDYDHDDPESWPESPTSWPILSSLKELSIIKATEKIMLEVLLFILHSIPNLCSLELIHCYFSAEAFGKCTSQTLESMRSLVISCTKYGYGDAQLTKFMPNLRRMRLLYGYENERAQMQSQYPRIKIETVEYRDFHDDDD
ncbi:hypothetical protein GQ42DRAFT_53966 [Ramicandelaber brevisporus]|nr:hypothetical protein GQ42DRAFT_53966 [Ramicandelaber brevisporus]